MIFTDFETYSEAGYSPKDGGGWERLAGAQKYGLSAVGAAVYAQHPSTEIVSLAWCGEEGEAILWIPGMPAPVDFFKRMHEEEIEAWNASFEVHIWRYVAVPKLGWPHLPIANIRCTMARSRAYSLPGKLAEAGRVLNLTTQKDKAGERLIGLFSVPRQPTKTNPSLRNYPSQFPAEAQSFYGYNATDTYAERAVFRATPPMPREEVEWWQVEQACNRRGVHVDMDLVRGALRIQEEIQTNACRELTELTGGAVRSPTEVARLVGWMAGRGVPTQTLDEEAVDGLLGQDGLPSDVHSALRVRQAAGSASVRKYAAIKRQVGLGDRLYDLFTYHGAHTGRETAADVQPQNLPNSGPDVAACSSCGHYYGKAKPLCPWCGSDRLPSVSEWSSAAAEDAIRVVKEGTLQDTLRYFEDASPILSACIRGVFKATDGHVMMGADFSAIEGVGAAMLTKEPWRIEVFRTHGKIYEMAGAKMLGCTLEEILEYRTKSGKHHPIRKRAKVGELAGGYGGSVGAWKQFGAEDYYADDDAIKAAVKAWRDLSPQFPLTWYAMHDAWVRALNNWNVPILPAKMDRSGQLQGYVPDVTITYVSSLDVLQMRLPSGRIMTYHKPRLETEEYGRPGLSFEGWNTNPKNGPYGWIRKRTFGGRLFENLDQAACRDLLTHAAVNVYHAGYELCLHVHDELCVEVPEAQYGILNEHLFAEIKQITPAWAKEWPVRVGSDYWVGPRFQK